MAAELAENEVVLLWLRCLQSRRPLTDTEGIPVEVLYPGRPNDERGGDFRDALVASGGECRSGCIEIHTRASGWQAHGHHLDPAYNKVVLHVALKPGRSARTQLQDGRIVPTIILNKFLLSPGSPDPACYWPCHDFGRRRSETDIREILDKAGELRLEDKAHQYRLSLSPEVAAQQLYEGVLEVLGYARNKRPFRELARRVPLKQLEALVAPEPASKIILPYLQALLLGVSGLLWSPVAVKSLDPEYIARLRRLYSGCLSSPGMSISEWEVFKVRPSNYPVRRIIALTHLLHRCGKRGWLNYLLDAIRQSSVRYAHDALSSFLSVNVSGDWASYYQYPVSRYSSSRAFLGQGRAAEIIINALLPFAVAWGEMVPESDLSRQAREIFYHFPRLEANSVERHMLHQLALSPRLVNSACRQQGLLYIYKSLCVQGKCSECFLRADR